MDLSKLLPAIADACKLDALEDRIGASGGPVVLGVNDAAKAVTIAAITRPMRRPVLVVAAKAPQAFSFVEELAVWLGEPAPVLTFLERDVPYERVAPDPEVVRERLRALRALHQAAPCVIVASGVALAQRTLPADLSEGALIDLRQGTRLTPETLISSLLWRGYRTVPLVEEPGEIARRGGIVDVFPAADEAPVRIEFLGDRVESLRSFDPDDQRSREVVTQATLGVGLEALDLRDGVAALAEGLDLRGCTRESRERFEEEFAQFEAGDAVPHEAFYVPFLASGCLLDHLPPSALLIVDEPADLARVLEDHDAQTDETRQDLESRGELPRGLPRPHIGWEDLQRKLEAHGATVHLSRWATAAPGGEPASDPRQDDGASLRLPFAPADAYGGRLRNLATDLAEEIARGRGVIVISQQAERIGEVLTAEGVTAAKAVAQPPAAQPGSVALVHGSLLHGWRLATSTPPLTLLTDTEIFGFVKQRRRLPRKTGAARDAFLAELTPGDYVVHIEHGIARFAGLVRRRIDGVEREYLELRYALGDRLYLPADQVDRVSRYVGPGDRQPAPTRLGSQEWTKTKERVRRAVANLAQELLELYAARQVAPGRAFSPDTPWQQELEGSFPYVETPDQLTAVREMKVDMERALPMDRLVCGDVGYGKTEVAVRAAFKAVMEGTQVAMLVPTTVLAQQHFTTFRERLAGFPVRVEMLSRFRSPRGRRSVIEDLASGSVDIVIGTHRLLQKDVSFKDLGLVIIDEEQRFGVGHKERLKQMRKQVDVLTLSATPIPRTLHMSLSGIRDMSTMETPPEERLPIKTFVSEYDDHLVREAILRELERGGQVYFLHNRVHDIELATSRLRELVPEAEIGIAHGQQPEDILEHVMLDFVDGRVDVLVCTTIIESGLDIPNVNTIIIDKADKLGLAQLYQLRGRVGRGHVRAYAYLLFDQHRSLSEPAQKRMQAIFESTELGAGFQIALRDLEIRGAGNLLGAEQSGHIGAVGFELYVRLLSDAVERLKALREGQAPPPLSTERPLTMELPMTAHLPSSYVSDLNLRLALYQRMAAVKGVDEAESLTSEMNDRFGPPPPAAENLLYAVRVRALANDAEVTSIQQVDGELVVRTAGGARPRERLSGLTMRGLWLGPTQVRLKLAALGEDWPEALLDVLRGLAEPTAPLAASRS